MPRKVRQLIQELLKAGFTERSGKGSHRNFIHTQGVRITISGKLSDDAKLYQEQSIRKAIKEVTK